MGMFDYVRSEMPLPDSFEGELQSKDFDCAMSTIVLRANGRLEIERFEYEHTPQAEKPYPDAKKGDFRYFCGAIRRINKRWEDLDFHGDFNFYANGSDGWHEYSARFTGGQLTKISVIETPVAMTDTMQSGATP